MIGALLGNLWPYLAAAGAALAALTTAYFKGRKDQTSKADKKRADDLHTAKEKRDEVDSMGRSGVRDALGKWVRKGK